MVQACVYVCVCVFIRVNVCVCSCVHNFACVCVCMCTRACMRAPASCMRLLEVEPAQPNYAAEWQDTVQNSNNVYVQF